MNVISNALKGIIGIVLTCIVMPGCNSSKQKPGSVKHRVEIKEMRFQPAALTVHAGDTIEWVNLDFVDHDVTELSNKEWSSQRLPAGKSWQLVIKKSADYYCSIHQVMKGKLNVQ